MSQRGGQRGGGGGGNRGGRGGGGGARGGGRGQGHSQGHGHGHSHGPPSPSSSSSSNQNPSNHGGEFVAENAGLSSTYIDTHCHVEYVLTRFKLQSFEQFLQRTPTPHNFEGAISVFCDPAAFSSLGQWPELLQNPKVWGSFGCHPHNAKYYDEKMAARIEECLKHEKAIAWGECGLDFVKNESPKDRQEAAFIDQILRAVALNKPLVVHSRGAEDETYEILKQHMPKEWRVHVHCFGESAAQAKRLLEEFPNLFLGFTGSITFDNSIELRKTIQELVPLDRILLETDAPYLPPAPFKGASHPGHIPVIALTIAKLKGISLEDCLKQIRENTKRMYGI